MNRIYEDILDAKRSRKKLLAILIDPEKTNRFNYLPLIKKINQSPATHIFVGGSSYDGNHLDEIISILKEKTLKIAPRFMQIHHLEGLSFEEKLKKSTVIWGIKEAIFKIKNEKGISFPEHIFEKPFDLNDKKAIGILQFNGKEEFFNAHFDQIENAFNSGANIVVIGTAFENDLNFFD